MQSTPTQDQWFVFFNDQLIFVEKTTAAQLPLPSEISLLKAIFVREHFIGYFNGTPCYTAEVAANATLPEKFITFSLRQAFEHLGQPWFNALAKAYLIINWDKNHRYCGRCGQATHHRPGTFERLCDICHLSLFPRLSPSVIVLIEKGDHLLMARSPHFKAGVFALIAGFVEAGESLEEAVHREVMEEVGIKIKNLRYFASQPWPFPDSLMVGFLAEYAEGELLINHNEIEVAGWYHYDNLPGRPSTQLTLAAKLIDYFIAKQHNHK